MPIVSAIDRRSTARRHAEPGSTGFADNAKRYNDNEGIVAAVDDGQVAAGIINHYYWFRDGGRGAPTRSTRSSTTSATRTRAPSSTSPAPASLASSDNPDLAQQFLASHHERRPAGRDGRRGDWEYPLNPP